jgi:type IV pilus assembly protein PilX
MATPMKLSRVSPRPLRRSTRRAQQGVVMAITLIALVLLLIGVAAMLRSVDTSSMVVGNLAFRRDLTNRSESAILTSRTALVSGALMDDTTRIVDSTSSNYSATRLASTTGIPTVLLSDSAYTAKSYPCVPASCTASTTDGTLLRWVIDRQCITGTVDFDTTACEYVSSTADKGGSSHLHKPGGASRPVYRISVRISGPRGMEAYYQTTYAD